MAKKNQTPVVQTETNILSDMEMAKYNPDILSCLSNLSQDEVFTPPNIVNEMLDMLPSELFRDPNAKFLDPCTKTGVFLREIAKRLNKGLASQIPDLQERIDHILKHQLYGIAITELTSLIARRSLYCSKTADGKYSVSEFETPDGNIHFKTTKHDWKKGSCTYCGASQALFDEQIRNGLETHAYEFIHTRKPEEIWDNMKFDVIIGNPPYHMKDGGEGGSATPIYQRFIDTAIKLNPKYLSMIIPARWYSGGRGLEVFRTKMLSDRHLTRLVDYPNTNDCFPGITLKGGVCYFLWTRDNEDDCVITNIKNGIAKTSKRPLLEEGMNTFIRYNEAESIFKKVSTQNSFENLVSSSKPFGLRTYIKGTDNQINDDDLILYANKHKGYITRKDVTVNQKWIDSYKVYISCAYGAGEDFPHQILNKPFIGEPGSVCTETYLLIGPFETEIIANNVISYIKTRFFRMMVLMVKNTQHAVRAVYKHVPLQDFSKPWTDEELYKKYNLSQDEIDFIESMIKPME